MSAPRPPLLEVRNLRKQFGDHVVLENVNLTVPRGTIVAIIGKSGTGKSVFLKCLAGILRPEAGEMFFDGQALGDGDETARAAFRKRCSYLFQGNALLDSLTAFQNVALPLEQTTLLPKKEIAERVRHALDRLELGDDAHRYPGQMSGGMQKRLALARAIVTRPELVLFDEPTAGLDPVRRNDVFAMIARYRREFGFTAVLVTHDLPEALAACDRISLLDGGQTHFEGTAADFHKSTGKVVAAFRDSVLDLQQQIASLKTEPSPAHALSS